jgi:DNA-binding winged helix-turn-helix (wHTH) protein/tetratricopeptide (TPR) repeat protein
MAHALGAVVRFGRYRFDTATKTLTRDGRAIELNVRCATALAHFLEHAGEIVTKDGLLTAVWPEGCVEPNNVPQTVYVLRRTFKIAGDDGEIIATVPGQGYRFVPAASCESSTPLAVEQASTSTPSSRRLERWSLPARAALIGGVLALSFIALLSTVRPSHPPLATIDPAARVAYEQGRFYWSRRTDPNVRIALNRFESAIRLDPEYPQAYSGLADTYSVMRLASDSPTQAKRLGELARVAAARSVALDDTCAECHASVAFVAQCVDRDVRVAETEFKEAIRLDPNYATAHEWYSWLLFYSRSHSAAGLAEIEKASELEPTSPIIKIALGWQLFYVRQFDRAQVAFTEASTIDPRNDYAFFGIALSQEQQGQYDDALKAIDEANRLNPDPTYLAEHGRILALQHRRREAEASLDRLLAEHPRPWYSLALVYDALNERQLAHRYLLLAQEHRDNTMATVLYDPRIDDLRPLTGY